MGRHMLFNPVWVREPPSCMVECEVLEVLEYAWLYHPCVGLTDTQVRVLCEYLRLSLHVWRFLTKSVIPFVWNACGCVPSPFFFFSPVMAHQTPTAPPSVPTSPTAKPGERRLGGLLWECTRLPGVWGSVACVDLACVREPQLLFPGQWLSVE